MNDFIVYLFSILTFSGILFQSQDVDQFTRTWQIESNGSPIWVTIVSNDEEETTLEACDIWWQCGNTSSDSYLFAVGNRESVRLILEFSQNEQGQSIAKLYVADPKEPLDYQIVDGAVEVLSNNGNPYLTMLSRQGDWIESSVTNYNLTILLDGPYNNGEYGDPEAVTDGIYDFIISIGSKTPGIPQWQTIKVVNDKYTYQQRSWPRFVAFLRMQEAPSYKVADPFMPTFPYFGIGDVKNPWYEENPLPVFYNVNSLQLHLAPFVGFQNGGMFDINSLSKPPHVNFEVPFGFYNFDTTTRQAHLVVRGGYSPAEAPLGRYLPSPRLGIRYSWKMDDDRFWRYGFQLSDFHIYTNTLSIGNTQIIVPQPETYPDWVMSKSWRAVTFIESLNGYSGSEGIYFYAPDNEDWRWLYGDRDTNSGYIEAPLLQEDTKLTRFANKTLPAGFRGEFRYAADAPPEMYFSPVDHYLHLRGGQGGIWNLGKGMILRTADLNDDGIIDSWQRERVPQELDEDSGLPRALPGTVIESLFDMGEYFLCTRRNQLIVVQSPHEQISFTLSAPTDKESWETFRAHISSYDDQQRNPFNLHAWLDAFPGQRSEIAGASLNHLRFTDDGFQFELILSSDFHIDGTDILGIADLEPGDYLVVNQQGQFHVIPLIPPQLTLDLRPIAGEQNFYSIQITNTGNADASDLTLIAELETVDGEVVELTRKPVDALADETEKVLLDILPPQNTSSIISVRLEDTEGNVLAETRQSVDIDPATQSIFQHVFNLSAGAGYRIFAYIVLLCIALLIGAAAFYAIKFVNEMEH